MTLATLSTGNFDFQALGRSESHARALVVDAFARHLVEYGSSKKQWAEEVDGGRYVGKGFASSLEDWYGIYTCELAVGVALRDGVVI